MKQLVQNLKTGETSIADVPMPFPQVGMVLVRTAASLVSAGTERMVVEFAEKNLLNKARSRPDLVRQLLDKARREGLLTTVEAAFTRLDQPMPLGYSSTGTIVAVGEGVEGFRVDDRVACAGGGYAVHAEYATIPKNLVTIIPKNVDFESAAFATLGAIALHGFRLAKPMIGEQIAVIGLGLLGLLTVGIAKAAGCRVFGVDLDPQRVELAIRLGARAFLRDQAEEAARSFSSGRGLDSVLICADTPSNDPVILAGSIARDRANVVAVGAVGLDIPRNTYFEKELNLINSRSYGPGRYDPDYEEGGQDYPIGYVRWTEGRNLEAIIAMMANGDLDVKPLITHRFQILDAAEAYALITKKKNESFLGVLLTYEDADTDLVKNGKQEEIHLQSTKRRQVGRKVIGGDIVKLGVIGAGNFAMAVMLPAIAKIDQLKPMGIVSRSGLSAAHAAKKFGFDYTTDNAEQILSDSAINTVAILTRHNLHAEQVCTALNAGKHVFVEKPLALTYEQLTLIQDQLQEAENCLLMIGFNRRFAPLAQQLYSFVSRRKEPLVVHYRVNAGYLPKNHWLHDPEIGGGRIIGEVCHFIDFLTFLVGGTPVYVSAIGIPDQDKYREDNVVLTFAFADGSVGTLNYLANGDKTFPKERIEIFTEGRVAVLDDFRRLELINNGRREVFRSRFRQDKGHLGEWKAFSSSILTNGDPPIPYRHLFGVTMTTFAAVKALRSGERIQIVDFPQGNQ
jgi:predicted dehydrogenase/NADPH:quinone reductase-like Zn-dependent oxidoreductase